MLWLRLLHPITPDEKKHFLKKLCFAIKCMFSVFLLVCQEYHKKLVCKDLKNIHFCIICKRSMIFYASNEAEGTLDLVLQTLSLSFEEPLAVPVITKHEIYWTDSISGKRMNYKLTHEVIIMKMRPD